MKVAVEHNFSGPIVSFPSGVTGGIENGYDSTKTMISSLLNQYTGPNAADRYVAPRATSMTNIAEAFGTAGTQSMPTPIKWSDNIYWIFTATNTTAAATRTVALSEFDTNTSTLTYKGFITLAGTRIAGNKTVRSMRAVVYTHSTGTVSTSGSSTTISGNETAFQDERIAVGARIGFGSTDPTQITTWYEIQTIDSNTSLTISGAVNLSGSTPYVIEEIRIALACSNVTLINGGIHLIKGLNYGTFTSGGTTIPEATTVDNIRASYLLTDAKINGAATQTATISIASPAVVTVNNHGMNEGDIVIFTTTGALPTGLTAATTAYVVRNVTANTFNLSATIGGAPVNTSGSQSGTHTIHSQPKNAICTLGLEPMVSYTDHSIYVVGLPIAGVCAIHKYNLRAALTVGAMGSLPNIAAGTSSSAFLFSTNSLAVIGTPSILNSGRVATFTSGAFANIPSLFFTTTTRIYRCSLADISPGSTSWLTDSMIEVPPGSSTTYSALSQMSQVEYSPSLDRLLISNAGARFGIYVTPYFTGGQQFEKYVGLSANRLKLTTTDSGASDGLVPQGTMTIWMEDGWFFGIPNIVTAGMNWLFIAPFGVDGAYAQSSDQYLITPILYTPNASRLNKLYIDHMEYAGSYGVGFSTEPYRIWYRTSGMEDNSGLWTELGVVSDLSNIIPSTGIQFKIAFDIMGELCVPTRIYSIALVYTDNSQDERYQPSLSKSSASNNRFAWRQVLAWENNIPNLQIRLYNADTGFLVLDDTVSSSSSGTWEYSTDGTSWQAWDASANTIGNYIRYTATTLPNNIIVRALLTQA